jgi:mRNA interferase MazF
VKRGELWTVAGGAEFARKPRPVVIVQSDDYPLTASASLCPLTTSLKEARSFRIPIAPTTRNGLLALSHVMIDKINTVSRSRLGKRIGVLTPEEIAEVDRALIVFLGLAP